MQKRCENVCCCAPSRQDDVMVPSIHLSICPSVHPQLPWNHRSAPIVPFYFEGAPEELIMSGVAESLHGAGDTGAKHTSAPQKPFRQCGSLCLHLFCNYSFYFWGFCTDGESSSPKKKTKKTRQSNVEQGCILKWPFPICSQGFCVPPDEPAKVFLLWSFPASFVLRYIIRCIGWDLKNKQIHFETKCPIFNWYVRI